MGVGSNPLGVFTFFNSKFVTVGSIPLEVAHFSKKSKKKFGWIFEENLLRLPEGVGEK